MDPKEVNVTLSPDTKALLTRIADAFEAMARAQQFNADQYAIFVEGANQRFAWEQRTHDEVEALNAKRHDERSTRDNETADALQESHRIAAAVQREQLRQLKGQNVECADLQSMIRSAVAEALGSDPK